MPNQTTKVSMTPAVKNRIKIGRGLFRENVKYMRQQLPRESCNFEELDYDEVWIERRIQTAARMFEDAQQFLSTSCPEHPPMLEYEWMFNSVSARVGYDSLDKGGVFSMACAVWILDQLKACGRLEEACQLFPQDDRIYNDVDMPDIWDASHDEATLRGMLWILTHRNDDCNGTKCKKKAKLRRTIMDEHTARGMQHQQVPSRQRFESILAMLPRFEVDQAVRHFEEAYHEVLRRLHISNCLFFDRHTEIMAKEYHLDKKREQLALEAMAPDAGSTLLSCTDELVMRRMRLQEEMKEAKLARQRHEDERNTYGEFIGRIHMLPAEHAKNMFTPEIAAIWEDFTVADPYAMCFAFLYLVDRNSDLPWVYHVTSTLMEFCACELPWFFTGIQAEDLDSAAENDPVEDWYGRLYENCKIAYPDQRDRQNLAQMLYGLTGCLLPRDLHYDSTREMLEQYDIRDEGTAKALMHCAAVLEEARNRSHLRPAPVEGEDTKTAAAVEQEMEALTKKVRALEEENKRLRQNEHNAYREARELQKKLEKLEADSELDRMELYNLREIVFNQDQEESETEQENDAIEFPYTSKKKIVIVGGHDGWLREIKPKLPDARYISRHENPDLQIIRNADVVWFQTNALSHKSYVRLNGEARSKKVRVEYFHCASAHKCAMELVREEEKRSR